MPPDEYLSAPLKTDRMPPGVPYIIGNEAAERFSYYGMNGILVMFMTHYLLNAQHQPAQMTGPQAESRYHIFVFCVYFLPIVGAFLADAVLGKYRTIFYLSIVYCFGHLTLALDHTRLGLAMGLGLIALGAGGIKPCVSANVGDQFGATNQHLLPRVFSWFYFSINLGSALSTIIIPWMLHPFTVPPNWQTWMPGWLVSFLEKIHGPNFAFGTPGLLMFIATVIFWLGRKKFVHLPPVGVGPYLREIWEPENRKALGNLLILVPFVAIFWALWQQNFSSWILQAEQMNRHIFGINWQPEQIQTVNPLFILLMLPLFSYQLYPAIDRVFPLTPLRKIGIGLFITAAAFTIVGWIQTRIDAGHVPHVGWQILAFVVLTAAEIMVSVTHLEFAYTQAPRKMKSLVMCTYLGAIALGNALDAVVNLIIERTSGAARHHAGYFFWFVALMAATALLFGFFARFYRGRTYIQEESLKPAGAEPTGEAN